MNTEQKSAVEQDGLPASFVRQPEPQTEQPASTNTAQATPEPQTEQPKAEPTPEPQKPTSKRERKAARKAAKAEAKAARSKANIVPTATNPAKSIVPPKFKAAYSATNGTCGDNLGLFLKEFTTKRNEDGREALDLAALKAVAKANDVDFRPYEGLNNGQKRMNVGNKLRGLLKNGVEVRIGDKVFKHAETALKKNPPKVEAKAKSRKPRAAAAAEPTSEQTPAAA